MRPLMLGLVVFTCTTFPSALAGQHPDTLSIDLAENAGKTVHRSRPEHRGTFVVLATNLIPRPGYAYVMTVRRQEHTLTPLVLQPGGGPDSGKVASLVQDECTGLRGQFYAAGLTTEAGVRALGRQATALLADAAKMKDCADGGDALRKTLDATRLAQAVKGLSESDDLLVTITRTGTDKDGKVDPAKAQSWTVVYDGVARGQWVATYGFTFISDLFARNEGYSTHPTATAGQYAIRRDQNPDHLRFLPTVMFSWLPRKAAQHDLTLVVTGGIGIDLERPAALLGAGLSWNQNLTLNLGVATSSVSRLAKNLRRTDTLTTALSSDQLERSTLRLNPFVSLSLRLSSNPFAKPAPAATGSGEGAKQESPGGPKP